MIPRVEIKNKVKLPHLFLLKELDSRSWFKFDKINPYFGQFSETKLANCLIDYSIWDEDLASNQRNLVVAKGLDLALLYPAHDDISLMDLKVALEYDGLNSWAVKEVKGDFVVTDNYHDWDDRGFRYPVAISRVDEGELMPHFFRNNTSESRINLLNHCLEYCKVTNINLERVTQVYFEFDNESASIFVKD